ncbi:MAG: TonB-dependent receptor [Bacteroidetes bacterium]|nr:TonB-dependent receptor [Bacteroidota bacterium]
MNAIAQLQPERFQLNENDLDLNSDTLQTQITTASRSQKFIDDLPVTVFVISRSEILAGGYTSLTDVLKTVPGIKVSQPGSALDGESFLMNGLYGNYYCKILINGIPIQPSVVSGMPIAEQLPIRQAERIEILYGPAAALYGGDALAGVINIITNSNERPVWAQADISLGTDGYYDLNVMIGGKVGKNKHILSYDFFGSYGQLQDMNVKYDIPGNYNPALYDTVYLNEPYYHGDSVRPAFNNLPQRSNLIGFGLKYRGLQFRFLHMYRNTHSSVGLSPAVYGYYDPRNYIGESIDRFSLGYTKMWTKFSTTTNLSLLSYRMDNLSSFRFISERGNRGVTYQYAASDDLFFEEVINYSPLHNLELTAGFSAQYAGNLPSTSDLSEPFNTSDYQPFSETVEHADSLLGKFGLNPTTFYNLGGFVQLYYKIKKFIVIAGGRWDEHSLFGSQFSPRIGFKYHVSNLISFKGNYGLGFRSPSLYYSYRSTAYAYKGAILYEYIPNENLNPERFHALEAGLELKPAEQYSFEVLFTYHKLSENITGTLKAVDPQKYPNSYYPLALAFVNDENSRAELYSGEVRIRIKNLIKRLKLRTDLFIKYCQGKEILPNDFGKLEQYRNMPKWFGQLNIEISPIRSWQMQFHQILSSKSAKRFFPFSPQELESIGWPTEVKGYYTLDWVNRFNISRNFQAFLIINNVFNGEYGGIDAYGNGFDLYYNPQYGRNFRLGFNFMLE